MTASTHFSPSSGLGKGFHSLAGAAQWLFQDLSKKVNSWMSGWNRHWRRFSGQPLDAKVGKSFGPLPTVKHNLVKSLVVFLAARLLAQPAATAAPITTQEARENDPP